MRSNQVSKITFGDVIIDGSGNQGTISLGNGMTLTVDTNGNGSISLSGNASISIGTGMTLSTDTSGNGKISLSGNASISLGNGMTLTVDTNGNGKITLSGNASIVMGNMTLTGDGTLTVNDGTNGRVLIGKQTGGF